MHKILDGEADKSYGIHVAKLAGIPLVVTENASKILSNLQNKSNQNVKIPEKDIEMVNSKEVNNFLEEFDKIGVDDISPRQALDLLYKLKSIRHINEKDRH